jgi:hypothetical protein
MLVQRVVVHHFTSLCKSSRQAPSIPENDFSLSQKLLHLCEGGRCPIGDAVAHEVDSLRRELLTPSLQRFRRRKKAHALQTVTDRHARIADHLVLHENASDIGKWEPRRRVRTDEPTCMIVVFLDVFDIDPGVETRRKEGTPRRKYLAHYPNGIPRLYNSRWPSFSPARWNIGRENPSPGAGKPANQGLPRSLGKRITIRRGM